MTVERVDELITQLDSRAPVLARRDRLYRGEQPLRFAADEVRGDLKYFNVNICRLAVNDVAERMRIKKLQVAARGRDVSDVATRVWVRSNMDQLLQPLLVDALALGESYLIVWVDGRGRATITPEPASQVTVVRDPISGEVSEALKRWFYLDSSGAIESEHVTHFTPDNVTRYVKREGGWVSDEPIANPLGVVPVVPVVNIERVGDVHGTSVIDDLAPLVDALSKVIADMLVASEDVARPRRWASGVDLEESDGGDYDGFTADAAADTPSRGERQAVSPFESGNRMFTVESPDAKFGQLPGADLKGYSTAVDIVLQQIMAISALPAHMMGVTTANPSSADGNRSAEASITARADSAIRVLGIAVELAIDLATAVELGVPVADVATRARWADPGNKSAAQEADAITKLHSLGIITTAEAREQLGYDGL